MRRLGLGQVGEEIEIVDDTEFDDLFGSAVVGNQIAAESREMGMVLQIDMHLLTRMGCEQNGQHKGREALFEADIEKIHSRIGWMPQVSAREGVEAMVQWVKGMEK